MFTVDEDWLNREPTEVSRASAPLINSLLAHEKEAIEAALARSHGRVSGPAGAAAVLGVPDSTLEAKIKRLGIDKYRFKPQAGCACGAARIADFPSAFSQSSAKSRKPESFAGVNSLPVNALRMAISLQVAMAGSCANNDVEDQTAL